MRESQARAVCRAVPGAAGVPRLGPRRTASTASGARESEEERAAAGFRVDMPVGRVARYPRGNGEPVAPRESRIA